VTEISKRCSLTCHTITSVENKKRS